MTAFGWGADRRDFLRAPAPMRRQREDGRRREHHSLLGQGDAGHEAERNQDQRNGHRSQGDKPGDDREVSM